MSEKVILALDQGTTSSRAILFDKRGENRGLTQKDFRQLFPQPGWVEHDPREIWESQISVARELVAKATAEGLEVAGLGITNQRETTLVWERATGVPIYNAIVWQDRRTAAACDALRTAGHADAIREKTGLVLDAYFSATKLKWILDSVPSARSRAEAGELCFGTVDTWLVWNLTGGAQFITDVTNASRTMLFNIHTLDWDEDLLALFEVPRAMLPEVRENSEIYGTTASGIFSTEIPIAGMAGDQHAALFGQLCLTPGMVKNTYGTGCFLMMNTGTQSVASHNKLLTTIAWKIGTEVTYALEGSVFVGGAAIQWLRDGLKLIGSAEEVNALAASVPNSGGVVFVPALTGLAAPHWDAYARGTILGITRGTTAGHIARATLEGIACQVCDIVQAMQADAGQTCVELRVDGGASASDLLMQIQCELLGFRVVRAQTLETTALGAAYLAGLAVGFWHNVGEIQAQWHTERVFAPFQKGEAAPPSEESAQILKTWARAISRARTWAEPE